MRAEQVLADHVNQTEIAGVTVRKGTVAAFLANARVWTDLAAPASARAEAERDILDALPALTALGVFDIFAVRDERLRAWISETARR